MFYKMAFFVSDGKRKKYSTLMHAGLRAVYEQPRSNFCPGKQHRPRQLCMFMRVSQRECVCVCRRVNVGHYTGEVVAER